MVKKELEIGKIRDKNKRIRKIMEDLDIMEQVDDPNLTLVERPERLLTVEDDEVCLVGFTFFGISNGFIKWIVRSSINSLVFF